MFIGTICVNAQVDEETKLKNRISEEKVLMDSCYKRMIDESLPEEERDKYLSQSDIIEDGNDPSVLNLTEDELEEWIRKYNLHDASEWIERFNNI